MKQEDKELLLKDLCARLPYGVKYMDLWNPDELPTTLCDINVDVELIMNTDGFSLEIEKCKPYLFPLSSMTEEQNKEYAHILVMCSNLANCQLLDMTVEDWFRKNHFDYRGLIPMGLANDATGLGIYD